MPTNFLRPPPTKMPPEHRRIMLDDGNVVAEIHKSTQPPTAEMLLRPSFNRSVYIYGRSVAVQIVAGFQWEGGKVARIVCIRIREGKPVAMSSIVSP